MAQHVLGHRVEHGEHPDGGAQLAHRGGRPQPAAHHVADDEARPGRRTAGSRRTSRRRPRGPGCRAGSGCAVSTPVTRGCGLGSSERCSATAVARASSYSRTLSSASAARAAISSARATSVGARTSVRPAVAVPARRRRARGRGPAAARTGWLGLAGRSPPSPRAIAGAQGASAGSGTARRVGRPTRRGAAPPRRRPDGRRWRPGTATRAVGHRTALGVEQALDQVDVHHGRPATGTTLRATPRATARRSSVSDRCASGLDQQPEPGLGRARSTRRPRDAGGPRAVCPGSSHLGILAHDPLAARGRPDRTAARCVADLTPGPRVQPSGRGDKLTRRQPPAHALPRPPRPALSSERAPGTAMSSSTMTGAGAAGQDLGPHVAHRPLVALRRSSRSSGSAPGPAYATVRRLHAEVVLGRGLPLPDAVLLPLHLDGLRARGGALRAVPAGRVVPALRGAHAAVPAAVPADLLLLPEGLLPGVLALAARLRRRGAAQDLHAARPGSR